MKMKIEHFYKKMFNWSFFKGKRKKVNWSLSFKDIFRIYVKNLRNLET